MDDETNKKMDEMLRSYAQKRGEGPAAPLHPATRRMLQDEVRRVHGKSAEKAGWSWALWWPRLAFASSLCLVAVLTVAVLRTNRDPAPPQDSAVPATDSLAPAPSPADRELALGSREADVPPGGRVEDKRENAQTDQMELSFKTNKEAGDTQAMASSTADLRLEKSAGLQDTARTQIRAEQANAQSQLEEAEAVLKQHTSATSRQLGRTSDAGSAGPALDPLVASRQAPLPEAQAETKPATTRAGAAPRPEALARAAEMTNLGAALRTRFVQTNLSPLPVLRSFQMEQLGDLVKFVDLDGSVYTGQLQRATAQAVDEQPATLAPAAKSAAQPGAFFLRQAASNSAAFSFTAAGVNRTLGSPVTVQGEYFSRTNRLAEPAQPRGTTPPAMRSTLAAPSEFIFGRTVVAGTNEAPLRAISVER